MASARTFEARLAGLALITLLAAASLCAALGTPVHEIPLVPCPVRWATDVACPGCGMTRACLALSRGDFTLAWALHPLAFVLVPIALSLAIAPGWTLARWKSVPRRARRAVVGAGLVLTLGIWVSRML